MPTSELLSWDKAHAEIAGVRPILAKNIDDLYKSQTNDTKKDLATTAVEYGYSDCIINNGAPVFPEHCTNTNRFIISTKLPLGIITRHACEVSQYLSGNESNVRTANRIIYPGEFIGLFELADLLTNVPKPPEPTWTIYSGVVTIDCVPKLDTQQNRNRLARAYSHHVGDLGNNGTRGLIGQLMKLPIFYDIAKEWRVRIIYFSREWVDLLVGVMPTETVGRVRESLLRRAWKNLARVRDDDPEFLVAKLRSAAGERERYGSAESAAEFLRVGHDVLAGRHPAFVPMRENSANGPFGDIANDILMHVTEHDCVLCPTYLTDVGSGLAPSTVGYLKLEHVAPPLVSKRLKGNVKDKVLRMMDVVRAAIQQDAHENSGDNLLARYTDILDCITFRTPNVRGSGGGRPSTYRVQFNPKTSSATPEEVNGNEFFKDSFSSPPNERCEFFRHSVRIDQTKLGRSS